MKNRLERKTAHDGEPVGSESMLEIVSGVESAYKPWTKIVSLYVPERSTKLQKQFGLFSVENPPVIFSDSEQVQWEEVIPSKKLQSIITPICVQFIGAFDEDSVAVFCDNLEKAASQCLILGQSFLPIIIDSYGGDVYSLTKCIDAINQIRDTYPRLKIATVVEGKAMSCGAFLAIQGDEGLRFATENSTLMIHDISTFTVGKNEEIQANARETERLNAAIFNLSSLHISKDPEYLITLLRNERHTDWYLSPKDAKRLNIINHIGYPRLIYRLTMDEQLFLPPDVDHDKVTIKPATKTRSNNKQKTKTRKQKKQTNG